ncbi:hypothetical protein [Nocardioides sp. MH1]|uniref:hypothetical protein n=1 Tax=Nocardioides sp. MH1 TaxID=3242490 RepID=UPI003522046B
MEHDAQPGTRPLVLVDGLTREQLLAAVGDARESGEPLDLEGHGTSGIAVLSLAMHQRRLGLAIAHVACLDARDGVDPVSGRPVVVLPRPEAVTTEITLVPGHDEASLAWTAHTSAALRAAGWPVS